MQDLRRSHCLCEVIGLKSLERVSKSQYFFYFIIYKQDLQLVLVDNV